MEAIQIAGAEIYYEKDFLSSEEATMLFNTLLARCAWERRRTSFRSAVPREEAYYGDPETSYTYSRREYKPLPWIPELLALKSRVEQVTPLAAYTNLNLPKLGYNAALCNLYRNGNDSVGLHADAEPEMKPVIASVSLGAERLPHGSLLIMAGQTQKNCKHEVPKEPDVVQPRINLTFRHIAHK